MIAHDLLILFCKKNNHVRFTSSLTCSEDGLESTYYTLKINFNSMKEECFTDIDSLIEKLQELTKPEDKKEKYKEAWYMFEGKIDVTKVHNKECYQCCDETHPRAFGRHMYASKQELIEGQIEYWQKQLHEEFQHNGVSQDTCANGSLHF
jgi:hypothetical protein